MTIIEFNQKFPDDKAVIDWYLKARYGENVKCNHCGRCSQVCPVLKTTNMEKYSPRSKMILFDENYPCEIFNYCTLCSACKNVCPNNIDIPDNVRKMRAKFIGNI